MGDAALTRRMSSKLINMDALSSITGSKAGSKERTPMDSSNRHGKGHLPDLDFGDA